LEWDSLIKPNITRSDGRLRTGTSPEAEGSDLKTACQFELSELYGSPFDFTKQLVAGVESIVR